MSLNCTQDYPSSTFMDSDKLRSNVSVELCLSGTTPLIRSEYFYFRLFWILFWLFGIIYTGYAVYQDTNHYLDYPSMILRKEESLGERFKLNVGDRSLITNLIAGNLSDFNYIFRTDKFSSSLSLFKFIALKNENSPEIPSNNRKMMPKDHI